MYMGFLLGVKKMSYFSCGSGGFTTLNILKETMLYIFNR